MLGVVLLIGAIYVVQREFRHLRLRDIGAALRAIPPRALVFSFGWTILSYFILTFYDRLGTIYAGHKVSYGRVAFASFCAYALSHNLGFAAVSGAAVRYRLYAHWGLTPLQIGKTVAFCSLTFGLGGMVLGGAILFLEPRDDPVLRPAPAARRAARRRRAAVGDRARLRHAVAACCGSCPAARPRDRAARNGAWRCCRCCWRPSTSRSPRRSSTRCCPTAPGLTWLIFLGVYVASYTAGLAANLPGGIGVFDTAMLFGLEPYVDAPHIVGAILVFRLYYYVIPLFLAGSLFAGNEILLRGGGLLRRVGQPARRCRRSRRWSEPDFAVAAATGVGRAVRRRCCCAWACWRRRPTSPGSIRTSPDIATQAGQFVPSLIGAGLVVMAIGAVAPGQPRLGPDDPAAGRRRRVRRDAGQPALGRRRAGADRRCCWRRSAPASTATPACSAARWRRPARFR